MQLSEYIKNDNLFNSLQTCKCAYGSSWQLLKDASGGGKEEALFRIQGILQYRDLSPIPSNQAIKKGQVAHLRQSVRITGFGTDSWEYAENVTALDLLQEFYASNPHAV
ncbi:hypothetical protein CPB83DRAFT_900571 [Crepidotus variabilis]|uniref:Uncharacterized protein n=1 Tax=Crepidotus variabilis TaxID=179855 RepID=A0A9P6E2Z7_9AGAR|nr:hypothetical protein CPB83DRAFT_900571 [Crepidotus variabilis]